MLEQLSRLNLESRKRQVPVDRYAVISKWHHLAIASLASTSDFNPDPEHIALRLGILPHEAEMALKRLLRMGILKWEGDQLVKTDQGLPVSDCPTGAAQRYHASMLKKSADALEKSDVDPMMEGIMVAGDKASLAAARREMDSFRKRMQRIFADADKRAVYYIGTSMFRLDRSIESQEQA